jgi:hypothetical protein
MTVDTEFVYSPIMQKVMRCNDAVQCSVIHYGSLMSVVILCPYLEAVKSSCTKTIVWLGSLTDTSMTDG